MAAQLLRKFPELRMVATDYDDEMVATARRRLATFGERATVQRVDATALPFPDGRFDVVLSFAMLHHVMDWQYAVAEALRVIRPGGQFLGYDLMHAAPTQHARHEGPGSTNMMRPGELEAEFGRLPVTNVRTQRAACGFAHRFATTKASAPPR